MRFFIDADLPRSTAAVLRRHGHEAVDCRDVGLREAPDDEIAEYARKNDLCLITGDFDFSDLRAYPPSEYAGIVVLVIPATATALYIRQLLEDFLRGDTLLSELPGQLAIVEAGRVRIRASLH